MDWLSEAKKRYRRNNQILFSKDSEYLQDLRMLFEAQDHKTMVLWALDFAAESVAALETRYPLEKRPREALVAAWEWASGKVKMRHAQRKILDCHAFAKEIGCKEDVALCHAVGQACSVVHTAGHAIGYPVYDLTAIIYRCGIDACREAVEGRKESYIEKLFYWSGQAAIKEGNWAEFICR
ncbi:MAG: putative immunity protein [Candidatus Pararuminococcus gallinarum]